MDISKELKWAKDHPECTEAQHLLNIYKLYCSHQDACITALLESAVKVVSIIKDNETFKMSKH